MGVLAVETRVCDRPGCGARVTDLGLPSAGLIAEVGVTTVELYRPPGSDAPVPPAGSQGHATDLCRECRNSLATWWAGKSNRAAGKRIAEREAIRDATS
jgi:hypothetical protein